MVSKTIELFALEMSCRAPHDEITLFCPLKSNSQLRTTSCVFILLFSPPLTLLDSLILSHTSHNPTFSMCFERLVAYLPSLYLDIPYMHLSSLCTLSRSPALGPKTSLHRYRQTQKRPLLQPRMEKEETNHSP